MYTQNHNKKIQFIFFAMYKNKWKEHKFWWKKSQKSIFYKNKIIYSIDDIDVNNILVSKKEPFRTKIRLNTLSDTMIMILLGHYA